MAALAEAGADVLFVEAPRSREQLTQIVAVLGASRPLLVNMVEGGDTLVLSGHPTALALAEDKLLRG